MKRQSVCQRLCLCIRIEKSFFFFSFSVGVGRRLLLYRNSVQRLGKMWNENNMRNVTKPPPMRAYVIKSYDDACLQSGSNAVHTREPKAKQTFANSHECFYVVVWRCRYCANASKPFPSVEYYFFSIFFFSFLVGIFVWQMETSKADFVQGIYPYILLLFSATKGKENILFALTQCSCLDIVADLQTK